MFPLPDIKIANDNLKHLHATKKKKKQKEALTLWKHLLHLQTITPGWHGMGISTEEPDIAKRNTWQMQKRETEQ